MVVDWISMRYQGLPQYRVSERITTIAVFEVQLGGALILLGDTVDRVISGSFQLQLNGDSL